MVETIHLLLLSLSLKTISLNHILSHVYLFSDAAGTQSSLQCFSPKGVFHRDVCFSLSLPPISLYLSLYLTLTQNIGLRLYFSPVPSARPVSHFNALLLSRER